MKTVIDTTTTSHAYRSTNVTLSNHIPIITTMSTFVKGIITTKVIVMDIAIAMVVNAIITTMDIAIAIACR